MTEEQIKEYDKFVAIAAKKNFHQVVCLAAGAIMLNSLDWEKTISEIIELAEQCKDCDEFSSKLLDIES